jgi:hypothetical protein
VTEHDASRRSTRRLPLVVRTAADIDALRVNSRAVRRLPSDGPRIALDGLNAAAAQTLKARTSAYIRACGCGEGAACALIALSGVIVFVVARISSHGARFSDMVIAAIGVLFAVLVGGLGKLLGLTMARIRFQRYCDKVIRMIEES